jgi:hypothetical protein
MNWVSSVRSPLNLRELQGKYLKVHEKRLRTVLVFQGRREGVRTNKREKRIIRK